VRAVTQEELEGFEHSENAPDNAKENSTEQQRALSARDATKRESISPLSAPAISASINGVHPLNTSHSANSLLRGQSDVERRLSSETMNETPPQDQMITDDTLPRLHHPLHKLDSFRTVRMTTMDYDDALFRLEQSMGLKSGELNKKDPLLVYIDEDSQDGDADALDFLETSGDDEDSDVEAGMKHKERATPRTSLSMKRYSPIQDEETSPRHSQLVDGIVEADDIHSIHEHESNTFHEDEKGDINPLNDDSEAHNQEQFPTSKPDAHSKPSQILPAKERNISHAQDLQESMRLLMKQTETADVELVVGKKKKRINAHSLILSLRSPVLQRIFSHKDETSPNVTKYWNSERKMRLYRFNLTHLDHTAFMHFLTYVYTGACTLRKSSVLQVLSLSRMYKITKLERSCLDFVYQHMVEDRETVLKLMKHSELENDTRFIGAAFKFLLSVDHDFKSFKHFSQEQIVSLFNDKKAKMTQLEAFRILVHWGKSQNPQDLRSFIAPLLEYINFDEIPPIDLVQFVKPENVVDEMVYLSALETGIVRSGRNGNSLGDAHENSTPME